MKTIAKLLSCKALYLFKAVHVLLTMYIRKTNNEISQMDLEKEHMTSLAHSFDAAIVPMFDVIALYSNVC